MCAQRDARQSRHFPLCTRSPALSLRVLLRPAFVCQMCDYRKHRLFVCDKDNRAVRVVSLRDILAAFVKEPKAGYFPVSFMDRCPSGPGQ